MHFDELEYRVLVCGGRGYAKAEKVYLALETVWCNTIGVLVVIEGGAPGADHWAGVWAEDHAAFGVNHLVFMANWSEYGPAAGHIRNTRMRVEGRPDLVIAFPGGRGTKNMVTQAKHAGLLCVHGENIDYLKTVISSESTDNAF